MIGEIDQDGNGCITFNEFVTLMTKNVQDDGDIEEEIREAFRVFDREGHGFITVPDLTQVLTSLGDKLSEGMFRNIYYSTIFLFVLLNYQREFNLIIFAFVLFQKKAEN